MRSLLLGLGLSLLAACGGARLKPSRPVDIEFGRIEQGARDAFERGDLTYSALLYQRVLEAARSTDDAAKIADSAFNLAAVQYARGQDIDVRPLLREARYALERQEASTVEVDLLLGRVELAADQPSAVLAAVGRLSIDQGLARRLRTQAQVLAGLAELELDRLDEARDRLASIEAEEFDEGLLLLPEVERLRARIAETDGELMLSARAFDREAELRQGLSQYIAMSEALELAGTAWQKASKPRRAADRWFRAARSRQGRGDDRGALVLSLLALEALDGLSKRDREEPEVADLIQRIRDLTAEVEQNQLTLKKEAE